MPFFGPTCAALNSGPCMYVLDGMVMGLGWGWDGLGWVFMGWPWDGMYVCWRGPECGEVRAEDRGEEAMEMKRKEREKKRAGRGVGLLPRLEGVGLWCFSSALNFAAET